MMGFFESNKYKKKTSKLAGFYVSLTFL